MAIRITAIETGWQGPCDDHITLDFDHRNRRRIVLMTDSGSPILLDRPRAVHLRDGDALRLEDGRIVAVAAANEALAEIHAHDVAALVRIAWHLGNRHLPTQLLPGSDGGRLRIRADHVIEQMAVGLGGHVATISAPFDPEGGAYAGDATTGAHHHHHHDHDEHTHAHG